MVDDLFVSSNRTTTTGRPPTPNTTATTTTTTTPTKQHSRANVGGCDNDGPEQHAIGSAKPGPATSKLHSTHTQRPQAPVSNTSSTTPTTMVGQHDQLNQLRLHTLLNSSNGGTLDGSEPTLESDIQRRGLHQHQPVHRSASHLAERQTLQAGERRKHQILPGENRRKGKHTEVVMEPQSYLGSISAFEATPKIRTWASILTSHNTDPDAGLISRLDPLSRSLRCDDAGKTLYWSLHLPRLWISPYSSGQCSDWLQKQSDMH